MEEQYEKLKKALNDSDFLKVNLIIEENYENHLINSLFFEALKHSNLQSVQYLLRTKLIDLRHVDGNERRAIHIAAIGGSVEVIRCIISSGTPINVVDTQGLSPLHLAILNSKTDAAILLIREGANCNRPVCYSTQETPIHSCARLGLTSILSFMLERGGNPNLLMRGSGFTPLHLAVKHRHSSCCQVLCRFGSKVDMVHSKGKSAFFLAVIQGNVDMVSMMLPFTRTITSTDSDGRTPLHYLAAMEKTSKELMDVVQILIDAGTDVNNSDKVIFSFFEINLEFKDGRTALHEAAAAGNFEVAKILINHGASVNTVEKLLGETPLVMSSAHNQLETLKLLLGAGGDVNRTDKDGKLALHKCIMCRNPPGYTSKLDCVEMLLERGSRINSCDSRGVNVLDQCVFNLILTKNMLEFLQITQVLIQAGLKLQTPNVSFRTLQNSPFCSLAWHGEVTAAKLLLDCGWSLEKEDWVLFNGKNHQMEDFFQRLRELKRTIPSLMHLCRDKTRDILLRITEDKDITPLVTCLPLPSIIKNYLQCKNHFDEILTSGHQPSN